MSGLRRWATSLAIVLLVHALLIGAACWWAARAPALAATAPPAALMLELAPMAQAPPAPPREVATGPLQQQQQRQAPRQPCASSPRHPCSRRVSCLRPSAGTNALAGHRRRHVAQTSAPPQVAADAAARHTAPQTTAGERSRAEATWEGRLLGHLQKHRRYPRQAERLRQQGVVYVRFAVARDGAVGPEAGPQQRLRAARPGDAGHRAARQPGAGAAGRSGRRPGAGDGAGVVLPARALTVA
jgi:protein TonB